MIEFKPVSLADQVYMTLETSILNGTYKKGEVLSEQRLSKELGVSRTPIREALGRLAYENLIRESPSGNIVEGISEQDVKELFEVKKRIEVLAVVLCAKNIDKAGLDAMYEVIEKQHFYATKGNAEKVRALDTEFHDTIYNNCGSTVYQSILSPIHHKLMRYRQASLEIEDRIMDSIKEHTDIYEAIESRNLEKVKELASKHIEQSYNNIKNLMKEEKVGEPLEGGK